MAVSVEEALRLIYKNVRSKSTKMVPIEEAVGEVIAHDIVATHNLPEFDNSAMDGYAVKCSAKGDKIEVTHTIFAGDKEELFLNEGAAYKIMTGAKIPAGCEAIVPVEDVEIKEGWVYFTKEIKNGAHIRITGEDIQKDEIIIQKNTFLSAYHIALLASQGISHVCTYNKPRIALFASGSELKMHYETLDAHQLHNTNTPTFYARAKELGCEVEFIGTARDSLDEIKSMIQKALDYDLIVTSGGVSVGDADFTKEAFGAFAFEAIFEKVDIKPGKPTTFGKVQNSYVLNLPGNPLAATLNFELFAKAIILALSGRKEKFISCIETKIKNTHKVRPGKRAILPGYFDGCTFTPTKKFAPGMVSPMAQSNGFIMIDSEVEELSEGASVKFIPSRFEFTSETVIDLVTRQSQGS